MNGNEENDGEYNQPLHSYADVHVLLHVPQNLVFFFHHFQSSEQFCQLQKFVHSSNTSDSNDIIVVASLRDEKVEGENGNCIDYEPGSEICDRNKFAVLDQFEIFVEITWVEDYDNI